MRIGIGLATAAPSGIGVAPIETARCLAEAGADVTLFASADAPLGDRVESLPVVRIARPPRALASAGAFHGLPLPTKLVLGRRLAATVNAQAMDVMHVLSPGMGGPAAGRVPLVVQSWFYPPGLRNRVRTMMPFARPGALGWLGHLGVELQSYATDTFGYRRARRVLANTEAAATALRTLGLDAEAIPPPVEVAAGEPRRERSERFRITFCGHPVDRPRKGFRHLLAALARLRRDGPVHVSVVGGYPAEMPSQVRAVERDDLRVELLGRVPRESYLELVDRRTDLLVFPSLYEEWGYALLEALAHGVPAVAFDIHPFSEILDEDTGITVAPGDPGRLAAAIDRARAGGTPTPAAVLASTRRRFGYESVAARLIDAYGRAIA